MTLPDIPEMDVRPAKRSPWRNLSLVWVVPLLALIVSIGVAWQSYNNKGTLITITFKDAAGITPKDTTIRFKDVIIGAVEDVNFSKDMSSVEVSARINKDVAATLNEDTLFWVVRPEVSARGISGLSTVLSGVYIDSAWTPTENASVNAFDGLSETPLIRPGHEGTRDLFATDFRRWAELDVEAEPDPVPRGRGWLEDQRVQEVRQPGRVL